MALRIDHSQVNFYIQKLYSLGYTKVSSYISGTTTNMIFVSKSGSEVKLSITENGWMNISSVVD